MIKVRNCDETKMAEKRESNHLKTSDEKSRIDLDCDEVLRQIGGTCRWQLINFLILCCPTMVSGFLVLTFVFTGNTFYRYTTCQ